MCLIISTPEQKKLKTADKNIVCYKEGILKKDWFYSRYMGFSYMLGINQIKISILPSPYNEKELNEGYHSYINFKIPAIDYSTVVCIIPKGEEYYKGGDNLEVENGKEDAYVSTNIIILGNVFNPITWLKILKYKLS